MFHIGDGPTELEMDQVDVETEGQPSTLGTGGGTDHDVSWIPPRPVYRWEGILSNPPGKTGKWKLFAKLGAWLGLTPFWRSGPGRTSSGISLDVRLEDGRYVVIDEDD
jgi:hypothetical protein